VASFLAPARHADALEQLGATAREMRALERNEDVIRRSLVSTALVLLVATVLASVLLGLFISRRVTRRVKELARAMERVSGGELEFELAARGGDEVAGLMQAFNNMVQELRLSRERIGYLEKISAWQEVARRLAHEIKNPLTPINLAVQELHRTYKGDDPRYRKVLDASARIVEEEVATLKRLVEAFSSFARLPEMHPEDGDLGALVDDVLLANAHLRDEADIAWQRPATPVKVRMDRLMIRQVVGNLLRNGIEASQEAGRPPRIRVALSADARRGVARLLVEDNGPGVSAEDRRRVFEPYYTTRSEGTGLGLAIVRKIVLMHRGEVAVLPGPSSLGGAAFCVELLLLGVAGRASGAWPEPPEARSA
jgi:nitrogen fixation/metabolism regulation signal transduction histidine kinase